MEDYKPNSHRFKEEQKQLPAETKRVEKVTTGKAMTKKKSEASKIASPLSFDSFIAFTVFFAEISPILSSEATVSSVNAYISA